MQEKGNVMSKKEPDPNTPLTDEEWEALGPPMRGMGELPPHARQAIAKLRGRPTAEDPKQKVTIRLDSDILAALRASGSGWQTRLNQHLREWVNP